MHRYIWLVPLLPLLGAAVVSYGTGVRPKPYVTSEDGAFSYTWIPGGSVEVRGQGGEVRVTPGAATSTRHGSVLDVEWSYQLDALSSIFMLVVTGVGLCIFVFATGYMHGDKGFYRFFAYLGLFMFSMLILVMGSNFMMMFVGWEGVGLCSYLLIGY